MITVLERDDSGWWKGTSQRTKKTGLFPYNYATLVDKVTKLANNKNRQFGRPVWENEFKAVADYVVATNQDKSVKPRVGVFFCGPNVLSKELFRVATKVSKEGPITFMYHKENVCAQKKFLTVFSKSFKKVNNKQWQTRGKKN